MNDIKSEERMKKFRYGLLKYQRNRELQDFENKIKLQCPSIFKRFNYANLEKSYELFENLCENSVIRYQSSRMSEQDFKKFCQSIIKSMPNRSIWLSFANYKWVGAIQIDLHTVLNSVIHLLAFDLSTIFLYTDELSVNECLMLDYDDSSFDGGYELFIWGSWSKSCQHLLKKEVKHH